MINYRILPENRLIVFSNWGVTSLEEIFDLSRNLWSDPEISESYDAILDNTHLEEPFTSKEIYKLIESRDALKWTTGKLAVISPDDVVFGLSRMHEMMSENKSPSTIRVFRDKSSALKWLDREELDIEGVFEEIRRG